MSRLLTSVRSFLELIRFSHTLFALPFALTGAVLAWKREGAFYFLQLVGILLCMAFARSAAMAFNRLADRHLDAHNPRTAGRHLPTGILRPAAVWFFLILCSAGFFASTLLFWFVFRNPWPTIFAGPVLGFIFLYSYTKRFTALAHFWLGASLLLAPVCAWVAIRGLPGWGELAIPFLLGGAVLFWVAGFDILYACQDVDFDRSHGLRSIPAALGTVGALRVAFYCHVGMLALLLALYLVDRQDLGAIYLGGVLGVAMLVLFQHHLVRPDDLSRVNQAFFHVNTVISVGLFVVVLVQVVVGV
jgi:4-hydroxybenzoate polyprenyltransferase